ncbi:MAG: alpha/beta hydrolase [Gammaproteobacteria bacterium]|nr:alpha/beta hydrolase [Gammaproteobacteria bacterium]
MDVFSASLRKSSILTIFTASLVIACASPVTRNNQFAADKGYIRVEITGAGFTHVTYQSHQNVNTNTMWHIYIEGDGNPWISKKFVATDPTTATPLMLRLMSDDKNPAIYLGRPCYLGMRNEPACNPLHWTHQRYSQQVVTSMVVALKTIIDHYQIKNIALFGHSGGGTLAMLMANNIPETRLVVTLAGNLDIQAWTQRHGYSALTDSLNPADQAPLSSSIRQRHYASVNDNNIPAAIIRPVVARQYNAKFIIMEKPDHNGWQQFWPKILRQLKQK